MLEIPGYLEAEDFHLQELAIFIEHNFAGRARALIHHTPRDFLAIFIEIEDLQVGRLTEEILVLDKQHTL